jgi:acyl-CoA synthetase (AMP-forming)/AMP-acid ligase II
MNLAVWVERHARRRPEEPALADGERVHATWREFAARTAGAAGGLRDEFGLKPGDRAAAVVGRPDAERGESVVAFVVAADPGAPPPAGDLDQTCLDHMARHKRPKDYRFVEVLPTNNYGKVVQRELRDLLRADSVTRST